MGYKVARLFLLLIAVSLTANAQTYLSAQSQKQSTASTGAWTSSTAADTAVSVATTGFSVAVVSFNPSGSITGGTINFEASDDGSTWYPVAGSRLDTFTVETTFALSGATKKIWQFSIAGLTNFRVRLNPQITGSGTGNIRVQCQAGAANLATAVANSPTVTANAGSGTFAVSGTVTSTPSGTQTVSGTVTANAGTGTFATNVSQVAGTTTDTNSGSKSAGTQRMVIATDQPQLTNALKVDGSAVTQPVSGTVTANIGTSGSLALDASVTGLEVSQASTTSGQKGILGLGAVTTAAPSYTTAQSNPLSLTTAGALRTDSSATTQPVSGTVTANAGSGTFTVSGTVTANAGSGTLSTNVAQLAGTTTDTNSGSKSAGTLRVVLATDQPQLTNKLLVTPDANSAVNVAQINGVATTMGNGVSGTGVQRVTIASDSTGQVALATGSNTIGALTANQSVNVAQVAGGTASTVATGVQKVGIADSGGTAFLSAANALNSTGGGVQAVQAVGQFDDSSPTTITENQFGNLRMSNNRNLYGTIRDAAGNERGVNVNASNQLTVSVDNGGVGSGSADSGNPVKIGGRYNSTPIALTNGQRGDLQMDTAGNTLVSLGTRLDATNDAVTASNTTGNVASGATDSGNPVKVGGKYNSSDPSLSDGQRGDLQLDTYGDLKTTMRNVQYAGNTLHSAQGSPVNGNGLNTNGYGTSYLTVNCNSCTGTTLAFEVTGNDNDWVPIVAHQVGTSTWGPTATLSSGFSNFEIPVSGSTQVRARISAISGGNVTVTGHSVPLSSGGIVVGAVTPTASAVTTDAALTSYLTSAASTNSTNVKASPGNVYGIRITNTTATIYYLRMYNLATAPTCSSSTGFVESIPALASTVGSTMISQPNGQSYTTGIGFCLTGAGANNDNTNAATGVYVTILYK